MCVLSSPDKTLQKWALLLEINAAGSVEIGGVCLMQGQTTHGEYPVVKRPLSMQQWTGQSWGARAPRPWSLLQSMRACA